MIAMMLFPGAAFRCYLASKTWKTFLVARDIIGAPPSVRIFVCGLSRVALRPMRSFLACGCEKTTIFETGLQKSSECKTISA